MKSLLLALQLIAFVIGGTVAYAVLSALFIKCLTERPVVTVVVIAALIAIALFLGERFPSKRKLEPATP